jgi:hypothetical protein
LSDLEKLRKDAINCLRVVKQLKQLLIEIDHLKSQTKEEDHEKFDELTSRRREDALKEIRMYQGDFLICFAPFALRHLHLRITFYRRYEANRQTQ